MSDNFWRQGVLLVACSNHTFPLDRVCTFWDLADEGFCRLVSLENRRRRLV